MTAWLTDERLVEITQELECDLWPSASEMRLLVTEIQERRNYQDVCDHRVFAEAEKEEAMIMLPGEVEKLVRAVHDKSSAE